MPPKTVKRAIKDALADLSNEQFKEFCDELRDRPGEPKVLQNKVEGKTRLEIADVLVTTFTEAGAPSVTAELLREIGCNEHADKLMQETGGQPSNNSGAASVNTTARGGSAESDFVDNHRSALIDRVSNIKTILDDLLAEGVVSQAKYDEIIDISNSRDRMRSLYSGPLNAAGRAGKEVFYKILQRHETFLMKDLQNNY
ncbi:apoptosis-associated speck-like protein containing a CARD [Pungitius pungitius]|uniref:apoptosis-associated speck-like protein containing a CARD n=1 Tax=Pungitius pungitius TaxID=134920 RepID=UPI002E141A71